MAHELRPLEGSAFLSIAEVLRRWRDAFAYVDADPAAGRAEADATLAHLARMVGSAYVTATDLDRARRNRDHAVHVRLADAPPPSDAYLETVITPETEIVFAYSGGDHEDAAAPLAKRAAAALGYQCEVV